MVRSKKEIRSEVGYSSQKEKEKLNKKKNIDNKKNNNNKQTELQIKFENDICMRIA